MIEHVIRFFLVVERKRISSFYFQIKSNTSTLVMCGVVSPLLTGPSVSPAQSQENYLLILIGPLTSRRSIDHAFPATEKSNNLTITEKRKDR